MAFQVKTQTEYEQTTFALSVLLCFVHWLLLLFGGRFGDKGKNFGFKDCAVNDAVVWVVVAVVGSGVSHHEIAAIDCLVYLM